MSLSHQQIMRNRTDFLDILSNTVPLLSQRVHKFLDKSDFFYAPASTRYHEAYEGGLTEHSLKVYEQLLMLNHHKLLGFSDESIAKVALFHDLCKANFYRKTYKNKKLEDGRWIRTETYEVKEDFPAGHGEKSVALFLVHGGDLTEEEMLAIRWHMGGFDSSTRDYAGNQSLNRAMSMSKLVVGLQIADAMAVWL